MAKKLFKVKEGKMIGGVCSGLGEYFDIDPTILRLIWVACAFVAGGGIFAYLIAMIVIPYRPDNYIEKQ